MIGSEQLERAAEAGYLAGMASYAELTTLPPELEKLVKEPSWAELEPPLREHWRKIARAIYAATTER